MFQGAGSHGKAPRRASKLWEPFKNSERRHRFTPNDVSGVFCSLCLRFVPAVLNACSGLRGGFSLTGVAGLAEQFLEAGAGAVVGTRWGVPDSQAAAFAESFYPLFFAGVPLGEAVRQSRFVLREKSPGDAAWLAYSVYGHPLAAAG